MTVSDENQQQHQAAAEAVYISGGCNRCPRALDWGGSQSQIVYALNNAVALLSANEPRQIACTFNRHTDRVNSVRWIAAAPQKGLEVAGSAPNEFVSASKDKTLIVWQGRDQSYEPAHVLQGHTDNVCVVDAMYFAENGGKALQTVLASASVDSTVRIWTRHSDLQLKDDGKQAPFVCEQEIKSKANGFALALKFFLLPLAELPLLLIGYENHKIEIHVQLHNEKENKNSFYCLHTLIGHEDWIRDIDVCQPSPEQLLVASCSQDNYIRLWKLDSSITSRADDLNDSRVLEEDQSRSVDEVKAKVSPNAGDDEGEEEDEDEEIAAKKAEKMENELKLKSSLFTIHSRKLDKYVQYSMNLESVLYGHEDWIYTVKFEPRSKEGVQPMVLISASIDKTIVVWKYDEENAIWIDSARVGDIGGTTLGFYGATFDPTGREIVAHGYQGALHLWKREATVDSKSERLTPGVINGGHFDVVGDICWEPEQQYFISVSKDQTTRFHAFWKHEDGSLSWHELGRPQIHGYDLTCAAFIDRFKFVSGADEKLLRVFEAPKIFLQNFYKLSLDEKVADLIQHSAGLMPQGASVPALGLSNKAVFDEEKRGNAEVDENANKKPSLADDLYKEVYFNIIDLNRPPTEEHLLQNTLWPEIQKLYGHGYELFTVAAEPTSKLIASACKATKPEHATVLVWQQQLVNNQNVYRQINALKGHELTVVQMKFSNGGRHLLTVSRDRSWKLFARTTPAAGTEVAFELVRSINSKNAYHTRIVWSCDWSHDDKYFMTTSRDKRVCVWTGADGPATDEKDERPLAVDGSKLFLELAESITACAFAPALVKADSAYLVALGFESGRVDFYTWSLKDGFDKVHSVEPRISHHLTVKRLSFRKTFDLSAADKARKVFYLASCSDDCTVRLYKYRE